MTHVLRSAGLYEEHGVRPNCDPFSILSGGKVGVTVASLIDMPSASGCTEGRCRRSSRSSTTATTSTTVQDFQHHPDVAIVVKIHGPDHVPELIQSLCLLHVAYNHKVLYDIIVFSTLPLRGHQQHALQQIVHPASLTVVVDTMTLHQRLARMTPDQQRHLLHRCIGANTTLDLTWGHRCQDGQHVMPLAYTWMSEFRAKHLWKEPILIPYKYMMWYDSDNFAMQVWKEDPVAFLIRNKLVLLMGNFGQGITGRMTGVQKRIYEAYNRTLCSSVVSPIDGRLVVEYGATESDCYVEVQQVHGFFHITDLDFYRLPQNLKWFDVLIGDTNFMRRWDDQLGVIVPAAMLEPNRTVEMERVGIHPGIMHNAMIMGKKDWKGGAFKAFWNKEAHTKFPEAIPMCGSYINVTI